MFELITFKGLNFDMNTVLEVMLDLLVKFQKVVFQPDNINGPYIMNANTYFDLFGFEMSPISYQ